LILVVINNMKFILLLIYEIIIFIIYVNMHTRDYFNIYIN